jgi:hypothetical protein
MKELKDKLGNVIPEKVYIQWYDSDGEPYKEIDDIFDDSEMITWCEDKINETDIEYKRVEDVKIVDTWHGISYLWFCTEWPDWAKKLWKKFMCKKVGFHLFDEVWSLEFGHRLYCDACGLEIRIEGKVVEDEEDEN